MATTVRINDFHITFRVKPPALKDDDTSESIQARDFASFTAFVLADPKDSALSLICVDSIAHTKRLPRLQMLRGRGGEWVLEALVLSDRSAEDSFAEIKATIEKGGWTVL